MADMATQAGRAALATQATTKNPSASLRARLGYDPRPAVTVWRGTSIPPMGHPLARTPERWAIAQRVFWRGPPWAVLRNASHYLWHVMDGLSHDELQFTLRDLEPALWVQALREARPGLLSKGAYIAWSLHFGLMQPLDDCDWPDAAHRRDLRPTARYTRADYYRRAAMHHRKALAGAVPKQTTRSLR